VPPTLLQTPALQPSGFQSQQPLLAPGTFQGAGPSQAPGPFTSPVQQVPQSFGTPDLTPIRTGFTPGTASHQLTPALGQFQATFSAVTGEPTPTQTTVGLSAPAQQAPPQTQP
jgi:hypothetical protein